MCVHVFQDKDLKQYLDDCGNVIHVHNVKVRKVCFILSIMKLSVCVSQTDVTNLLVI